MIEKFAAFERTRTIQDIARDTIEIINKKVPSSRRVSYLKKCLSELEKICQVKQKDPIWAESHPIIICQMIYTAKMLNMAVDKDCHEIFDKLYNEVLTLAQRGELN